MGWFTPASGLSPKAKEVLEGLASSGSSEAAGVADCLNTIAENGGEQAEDDYLVSCAEEMGNWASAFIAQMNGKAVLYAGVSWNIHDVKTLFDVSDEEAEAFWHKFEKLTRDRMIELGWGVIETFGMVANLKKRADDGDT